MLDTPIILNPLVSVVVPCYNYGHFLPETLASLLQQSCQNWECIVVDDGSVDDTRKIVEQFVNKDNRFKYIYQKNKGLPSARNTGIREASGSFIQFLDADDRIEADKLKVHTSFLLSNPETDIVYGDWDYFGSNEAGNIYLLTQRGSGQGEEILKFLVTDNMFVVSAALVRRSLLDRCDGFDETLNSHEDWDLWLRCALRDGTFQYLNREDTMTLIRSHAQNMSKNAVVMHETNITVRKKIQSALRDTSLRSSNNRGIREVGVLLAVEKIKHGHLVSGLFLLLRSCFSKAGISMIFRLGFARCGTSRRSYR